MPSLMEIGLLVLEKILKNFQCIFTLFLEKGNPLHLNNLESPPKDDLCQVWLKLALWFWRSRKCKSLQTDGQTKGDQNSSLELSAQVN
jgi:hypothetical protein